MQKISLNGIHNNDLIAYNNNINNNQSQSARAMATNSATKKNTLKQRAKCNSKKRKRTTQIIIIITVITRRCKMREELVPPKRCDKKEATFYDWLNRVKAQNCCAFHQHQMCNNRLCIIWIGKNVHFTPVICINAIGDGLWISYGLHFPIFVVVVAIGHTRCPFDLHLILISRMEFSHENLVSYQLPDE